MNRHLALRALKNLCAFVGAIALISYFGNFFVDLRHWYVTLASALVCLILWLGFYVIELRGGITHFIPNLSDRRAKQVASPVPPESKGPNEDALVASVESMICSANMPVSPPDAPAASVPDEVQAPAPNPLPWLKPASPFKKAAGKS